MDSVAAPTATPTFSGFSLDSAEHLFRHHLLTLTPSHITSATFKCFERFFRLVNARHGVMLYATHAMTFVVVMGDVMGEETTAPSTPLE